MERTDPVLNAGSDHAYLLAEEGHADTKQDESCLERNENMLLDASEEQQTIAAKIPDGPEAITDPALLARPDPTYLQAEEGHAQTKQEEPCSEGNKGHAKRAWRKRPARDEDDPITSHTAAEVSGSNVLAAEGDPVSPHVTAEVSNSDHVLAEAVEIADNPCVVDVKNRRVWVCLVVVVLGFIGFGVALGVSLSSGSDSSTQDDEKNKALDSVPMTPLPTTPQPKTPSPTTSSPTTSTPTTSPPSRAPTPALLWQQVGSDIDGPIEGDQLGSSLSLSRNGTLLAVGAPYHDRDGLSSRGLVRVYEEEGGSWKQLGPDLLGDAAFDYFGSSVAMSGDGNRVAVGAYGYDGLKGFFTGQVKVFEYQTGSWVEQGNPIIGEASGDSSGRSVSLSYDGNIVAVGADENDGKNGDTSGHCRVYAYSSGAWFQRGEDIDGEAENNDFGYSVSLSDDGLVVAIGAWQNDGTNGDNSGHVQVYTFESGAWGQQGQDLNGEDAGDSSGEYVSLSGNGNVVAIGARYNDGINRTNSGHVRVYAYNPEINAWLQRGSDIDGEAAYDNSGSSVSLSWDGTMLAVGARNNNGNALGSGHVRVYKYSDDVWMQVGGDIDGESEYDYSGNWVSLSEDGTRVAIGARGNDANGASSGHVRVYDLLENV